MVASISCGFVTRSILHMFPITLVLTNNLHLTDEWEGAILYPNVRAFADMNGREGYVLQL